MGGKSDRVGNFFFFKKRISRVWYKFCFIFSTHHCASFFLSRQRCKNDSEKEWNESADLHWFLGIELREESSAPKNQIANHSLLGFFLCVCVCAELKRFRWKAQFLQTLHAIACFLSGLSKNFWSDQTIALKFSSHEITNRAAQKKVCQLCINVWSLAQM